METEETMISVELKYCERCGALWCRVSASGEAYCPACVAQVTDIEQLTFKRGRPRLPVNDRFDLRSAIERLPILQLEGGQA